MVTLRRLMVLGALVVGALSGGVQLVDAHPLHTTLADIQLDRRTGAVRVMVRVFADDLDRGIARDRTQPAVSDADRDAYVSARLGLSNQQGRSVALQPCGLHRQANLLWICLQGRAGPKATLTASDALLVDVYADQVNLVQATDGRAKRTVLFTRNDRQKPIL